MVLDPRHVLQVQTLLERRVVPGRAQDLAAQEVVVHERTESPVLAGIALVPVLGRVVPDVVGKIDDVLPGPPQPSRPC